METKIQTSLQNVPVETPAGKSGATGEMRAQHKRRQPGNKLHQTEEQESDEPLGHCDWKKRIH